LLTTPNLHEPIIYTRDVAVPLSDDDRDMENGWRMIPVPPTGDGGWIIVDDCSDRKTGWVRRKQINETVSRH
jgi:hypothetical protein